MKADEVAACIARLGRDVERVLEALETEEDQQIVAEGLLAILKDAVPSKPPQDPRDREAAKIYAISMRDDLRRLRESLKARAEKKKA